MKNTAPQPNARPYIALTTPIFINEGGGYQQK